MLIETKLRKGYCFSHFIHSTKLDPILQRPEVSVLFQVIQTQPITAICQLALNSRKNA